MSYLRVSGSVAVLSLGFALAGCGGGTPPTPSGYARDTGKYLSIVHPKGWQRVGGKDIQYRKVEQGRTTAEFAVHERMVTDVQPDMIPDLVQMNEQVFGDQYHRSSPKKLKIDGAKTAERIDFSYAHRSPGPRRPGASARPTTFLPEAGVDVAVIDSKDDLHDVRIEWLSGHVDTATVNTIVNSVRLVAGK